MDNKIQKAIEILKEGKTLVFPTDTVYGIGCNAYNHDAVKKIFDIKQRSMHFVAGLNANKKVIEEIAELDDDAKKLIDAFWPGALTIIVPIKRPTKLSNLTHISGRLGVRIPNHPDLIQILENIDFPIISPSANRSGFPTASTRDKINVKADYSLANIPCTIGKESTYYDVIDKEITRPGVITKEQIEEVLGYKINE